MCMNIWMTIYVNVLLQISDWQRGHKSFDCFFSTVKRQALLDHIWCLIPNMYGIIYECSLTLNSLWQYFYPISNQPLILNYNLKF